MLRGGMLSQWIAAFQSDPLSLFISLLIEIPALLLALILHEISHGYVALWCGDGTAKMMGRLSLNPSHHLDPIGTLCLVLFGFGWAKPVPINPRNFKHYVRDDFLVSIAGITMNFLLFLVSSFLMVALSKADGFLAYVVWFLTTFASINLSLAVFNLIPFPPLDGYHVLNDILLKGRLRLSGQVLTGLHILFLVLCYSTNIVSNLVSTVAGSIWSGVVGFYIKVLL